MHAQNSAGQLAQWVRNNRKGILTEHLNIKFSDSTSEFEVSTVLMLKRFGEYIRKEVPLQEYLMYDSSDFAKSKSDVVKKMTDKDPAKLKQLFDSVLGKLLF